MTLFDVIVTFTTDKVGEYGEAVETVEADTLEEAFRVAESLHNNTEEYDVEAIDGWKVEC